MILQSALPYDPHEAPPLPGIRPLGSDPWLIVDDAYAAQMAERERLLRDRRDDVLRLDADAFGAARDLLDTVLTSLPGGFRRDGDVVRRPDGIAVRLDRADPMATLGRLVQEDLCLLEKRGDEHVLTGAVLCFPASWMLSEKFLRPLVAIHRPVAEYDAALSVRVQRLLDGVQPGRGLWRCNAHRYADAALFQPRSEAAPRPAPDKDGAPFLRSERQCILRLAESRAVVFSIHTYVVRAPERISAGSGSAPG
ncbi:DUF3445 domain-containing protein [Thalassococcus sp. CAU 1522]|uniref:DUF3445 domain-containing protein n=1 Tax=Thalassococcus arenae TaxID=2851652 RepID=A0ABS6NCT8_9RHOB|nr:DUF3445 domain-containing protein [Thalassococcus arenae]MBV2361380.1 DUF3445 domain-containing protein [Thalassococcus arenae]